MKTIYFIAFAVCVGMFVSCSSSTGDQTATTATENSSQPSVGQSGVKDDVSNPNIVQVAVGSKDHTTLVAAVKAAELVDALSNAGPFTVFAPTNAAFEKLPAGTVEGLLKPEKKEDLQNILSYHTYVGSLKTEYLEDGKEFEQVNGQKIKITKNGDKILVNGKAEIIATIPTSNGIIHVINEVLLPPSK